MTLRRLVLLSLLTLGILFVFAPTSYGQVYGKTGPYTDYVPDPCDGAATPDDCMWSPMGSGVNMTCRAQLGVPSTYCWTYTYDDPGHRLPICSRAPVTTGGCTCSVSNGRVLIQGSCSSY